MTYLTEDTIEVIEKWDCYNDCPSGEYYIQIQGLKTEKDYIDMKYHILKLQAMSGIGKEELKV